jgi:hypothetical protein
MASLRWHEEGDELAATVRRPRSVFIIWLLIIAWNVGILVFVAYRKPAAPYYFGIGIAGLVLMTVRAYVFKARITLRGGVLRVKVGPVAPGRSTEIPLADIDGFEVESRKRKPSAVIVRRRSGPRQILELPLDGMMFGPNWNNDVWHGTAPVEHHQFIAAWLEKALAKARRSAA